MPPSTATTGSKSAPSPKVAKSKDPVAKKRRVTRSIQMPPKSVVRAAERQVPSERDMELAIELKENEQILNLAGQNWLKNYSSLTPTKPFAVITCASTVTALSAIVDSITALCNETITPMYTNATFEPQNDTLDGISRQLSAVADELSGISARFQARKNHIKSA